MEAEIPYTFYWNIGNTFPPAFSSGWSINQSFGQLFGLLPKTQALSTYRTIVSDNYARLFQVIISSAGHVHRNGELLS